MTDSDAARLVFADRLPLAHRYAELLAGDGVAHGLLGPSEGERVWDRHLLNSAVVAELLPADARVVDVGSGAGLPGIAIACARADVSVDLVESMRRRVAFLTEVVGALELGDRVHVRHGRAETREVQELAGNSEWVTARAVAPLGRLAVWCLPLARPGGRLLAIKGDRAEAEVREYAAEIRRAGGVIEGIELCGADVLPTAVKVVVVRRR